MDEAEEFEKARKDYEDKCLIAATIAYSLMKKTIKTIESMEPIEISCGWDGTITVDGNKYFESDLQDEMD